MKSYPDFLVIGAGRAGTTWLYENLKLMDGIWLPPNKELHYFDRDLKYPSPNFLAENSFVKRIMGNEYYNKDFRRKMVRKIGKSILNFDLYSLFWRIKYYSGYINDNWYKSLFKYSDNTMTGDITPAYQLLDENDVRHIYNIMPHSKIIFILRDPIERTWSQIRKNKLDNLSKGEIERLIHTPDIKHRNDYLATINIWLKYFPKENFKVLYFDDIQKTAGKTLTEVITFLRGHNSINSNIDISKKINAAPKREMPNEIKITLAKELQPLLFQLSESLGGYPREWFERSKNILNTN